MGENVTEGKILPWLTDAGPLGFEGLFSSFPRAEGKPWQPLAGASNDEDAL